MSVKTPSRAELRESLVERRPDDHKGVYGHVLLVAGSRGMAGAAILAARGALRSGAGLVTVAAPQGAALIAAAAAPSALTLALPENASGVLRADGVERLKRYAAERRATVLAMGPGLTVHADAARFVLHALSGVALPAVVDADALNILAAQEPEGVTQLLKARKQACIFTPHPRELARIQRTAAAEGEAARLRGVERLARDWGGVALLKGARTLISTGARTAANATGSAALAKAGSGDVLTGLIAGLWAQMLQSGRVSGDLAFRAACLGAWLHGAAGEAAAKDLTAYAAVSSDLPDYLPQAFAALES